MPYTGTEFVARGEQLDSLDEEWAGERTKVVEIVARGGAGKSAPLNAWIERMAGDSFRGAERVYSWSFYSQGTSDVASSDQFVADALEWFGDPDPTQGSPWDKGVRLANLVRQHRTLLILDGMEPLQTPPGVDEGRLRDPALQSLLRELATSNPGLCVITTRIRVTDLDEMRTTVRRIDLEDLSPEAGVGLLKKLRVDGTDAELDEVVKESEGHALALSLLGSLLRDRHGGDVRRWRELPPLTTSGAKGGHARRVMDSYVAWFRREHVGSQRGFLKRLLVWLTFSSDSPEAAVLRILGLFSRPADGPAIEALRQSPVIRGLTDAVMDIDETRWAYAISRLRRAGLAAQVDPARPDALDAHPLVREHFGEKLKKEQPRAWREANSRLFDHYRSLEVSKEFPETIAEMQPLYQAVVHGCMAGRHKEALNEVYRARIQRGGVLFFNVRFLGALGADLAMLPGFFQTPWSEPVAGLDQRLKGYLLNQAGALLRVLGRPMEGLEPLRAGLGVLERSQAWRGAAIAAGNLGDLHATIGDLARALRYAEDAVRLAKKSEVDIELGIRTGRLGGVLHEHWRLDEAEAAFNEAEKVQRDYNPEHPLLYSYLGFQYCDLLLTRGECEAVLERATQTLLLATEHGGPLDIAFDNLSLGRAHMMKEQTKGHSDFSQASQHLHRAVQGLRDAGQQDQIPSGLLARAELMRVTTDFGGARRDLDEAITIAERGSMRKHEADCHLGYARLALAEGHHEKAREHRDRAKAMIDEMGYHRRDPEVAELNDLIERGPSRP